MSELSRDQFVSQVIGIVEKKFPLMSIHAVQDDFAVRIKPRRERGPGHFASLENLYRLAILDPSDVRHHIERWAVELLRASEGHPDESGPFDAIQGRVMPMILPAAFCDQASDSIISQPLLDDLRIAYAIDSDRTISYISPPLFQSWNLTIDQVHEAAIGNLVKASEELQANVAQDEQGKVNLIILSQRDGYDASRLLLPTLHKRLSEHVGSPFVAAIPHRDILLCFRNDSDMVQRLRPQISEDYQRMPHQLTDKLLLVTADGVAPY